MENVVVIGHCCKPPHMVFSWREKWVLRGTHKIGLDPGGLVQPILLSGHPNNPPVQAWDLLMVCSHIPYISSNFNKGVAQSEVLGTPSWLLSLITIHSPRLPW
jgi:hypothetical protein